MAFSDLFSRFSPSKRRAEKADKARDELKANAEKALRMKQEADSGTHIPPHQTANEGWPARGMLPEHWSITPMKSPASNGRAFS
jgi:hypothetical protein